MDLLKRTSSEDCSQLAKTYSQDTGTAPKGGDLGFLTAGMVHQNIEDAVLRMRPGEVSDTIQTPLGYHIIQRIN